MKAAFAGLTLLSVCAATAAAEKVARIKIDGAIGPATANYISRSIADIHRLARRPDFH